MTKKGARLEEMKGALLVVDALVQKAERGNYVNVKASHKGRIGTQHD